MPDTSEEEHQRDIITCMEYHIVYFSIVAATCMEVIKKLGSVNDRFFWPQVAMVSAPKLNFFKRSPSDPHQLMSAFTRIGLDSDTLRLLGSTSLTNFSAQPLVDFIDLYRRELQRERTSERAAKRRRFSNPSDSSKENQKLAPERRSLGISRQTNLPLEPKPTSMQGRSPENKGDRPIEIEPKKIILPERSTATTSSQNNVPTSTKQNYNSTKDVDLMIKFPIADLISLVQTCIQNAKDFTDDGNTQFYLSVWASNAASAVRPNQVKEVIEALVRVFTSGRSFSSMNFDETAELRQLGDDVATWARERLRIPTVEKQFSKDHHQNSSMGVTKRSHGNDGLKLNEVGSQGNPPANDKEAQRSGKGLKSVLSSDFNELPDYSPPISTLPNNSTCLLVEFRNQSPLDLTRDPHRHLLHIAEIELCSRLRFSCGEYLYLKRAIFVDVVRSYSSGIEYKKTFVRKRLYWNTIKAGEVWNAFRQVGWFQPKHFVESVKAYRARLPSADKVKKNAPNQGIALQKSITSKHQRLHDIKPNNSLAIIAAKKGLLSQLDNSPLIASALSILNVEISRNQDITTKLNEIQRLTASQHQGQKNSTDISTPTQITTSWLADHLAPSTTTNHGAGKPAAHQAQTHEIETDGLVEYFRESASGSSDPEDAPSDSSWEPRSRKRSRRSFYAPGQYRCTICNIGFSLNSTLTRHYQSVRHEMRVNRMAANASQNDYVAIAPKTSIEREQTLKPSNPGPKLHRFGNPAKRKASPSPRPEHFKSETIDNVIDLAAGGESSPDYAADDTAEDLYTHLSKWNQAPPEGSFGSNRAASSNDSQQQQYECPLCGSNFAARHQMESHYSSQHPGQKLLECPQQCGKFCATEDNLDAHVMMHWQ